MPRDISSALQALINSGHCRWHSTVDLTLTDDATLYLSTGEIEVDGTQYAAQLSEVSPFETALAEQIDQVGFKVQNIDKVMGQALTGAERRLDGAEGMHGIIFEDETTGATYYDPKMPGEIISGEVNELTVDMILISVIDASVISGRTLSSIFPWREPLSTTPVADPDDLFIHERFRRRTDPFEDIGGDGFRYRNVFVQNNSV